MPTSYSRWPVNWGTPRPLHVAGDVLGDRLTAIAELDQQERDILTGVIDALLTKTRLRAITSN